jgi:hypothetical protein
MNSYYCIAQVYIIHIIYISFIFGVDSALWVQLMSYLKEKVEIWEYGRRDPSRWKRSSLYPQTLALTSPTSDGLSVGIVRLRTQDTEFSFLVYIFYIIHIYVQCLLPFGPEPFVFSSPVKKLKN